MIVQHNLTAMNNARNFVIISGKKAKTTEKLSSGYRINRAGDDAAGLAISEKMRRQIRGLNQASLNAQDGISLVQTAEGGLHEAHDIIHRMRELAVQAANGTNSKEDREAIQMEIDELILEIDKISQSTEFNGIKLLNGSLDGRFGSVTKVDSGVSWDELQSMIGEDDLGLLFSTTFDYTTSQVPVGGDTSVGYEGLAETLEGQIVPQIVKSLMDNYSAFNYLNGSAIGIGLRLYNQASNTGAYVSVACQEQSDGGDLKGIKEYQLGINLRHVQLDADGNITADSRKQLEATIAHEMIHAFMAEATTNGMVGNDGFPEWFTEGMAQTASGPGSWLPDLSTDAQIKNYLSKIGTKYSSADPEANYGTGYLASMYLGYMAGNSGILNMSDRILDGLNNIMAKVMAGDSLNSAVNAYTSYDSLEAFAREVQNDADAYQFVKDLIAQTGSGLGGLVTGDITDTDLADDIDGSNTVFKLHTDSEKVQNIYSGDYVILSGGGLRDPEPLPGKGGTGGLATGPKGSLKLHVGTGSEDYNCIEISIESISAKALGVRFLSVTTQESAGWAMDSLEVAVEYISRVRSTLGAYQNRLEHTIANLDNVSENTQAAESRIRDADMAKEMVEYSSSNIIMQASQSLLAQSNQSNQGVLTLLG